MPHQPCAIRWIETLTRRRANIAGGVLIVHLVLWGVDGSSSALHLVLAFRNGWWRLTPLAGKSPDEFSDLLGMEFHLR